MKDNQMRFLKAIRSGEIVPERAGQCWSEEERRLLAEEFDNGRGISQIALLLGRSELAVCQQLIVNEQFSISAFARQRGPNIPRCKCPTCSLREDCAYIGDAGVGSARTVG